MRALAKLILLYLFFICSASPGMADAAQPEFGISTGDQKGTDDAFGNDLAKVAQKKGLKLKVIATEGSLENMYKILKNPDLQLAIVQHDVLFWMEAQADTTAKSISQKTKMILPLYDEEVHILAREGANIREFEDLAGKRVAIGKLGSGTSITAETLFRISKVTPGAKLETGGLTALSDLKSGRIDAMFYVAGAPVKLFADDVTAADKLNFVNITNKDILEVYRINPTLDQYGWMNGGVRTIAVKAVLVTYDYVEGGRKCSFVENVARSLWDNLDELRQSGHQKWQGVNLDADVRGWDRAKCVAKLLNRDNTAQGQGGSYPAWLKKLKQSSQ